MATVTKPIILDETGQAIVAALQTIASHSAGLVGQGVPAGGTTGQVLKKKSNTDYDTEWANESGGGTSDYSDLTNKPQINSHTLSGNQSAADLGLGTYSKPSGGIPASDLESGVIPYVTPEMYGAKGDGVTDDTVAIQAAVDSGSPVKSSEAVYLTTSPITITGDNAQVNISGTIQYTGNDAAIILSGKHLNVYINNIISSAAGISILGDNANQLANSRVGFALITTVGNGIEFVPTKTTGYQFAQYNAFYGGQIKSTAGVPLYVRLDASTDSASCWFNSNTFYDIQFNANDQNGVYGVYLNNQRTNDSINGNSFNYGSCEGSKNGYYLNKASSNYFLDSRMAEISGTIIDFEGDSRRNIFDLTTPARADKVTNNCTSGNAQNKLIGQIMNSSSSLIFEEVVFNNNAVGIKLNSYYKDDVKYVNADTTFGSDVLSGTFWSSFKPNLVCSDGVSLYLPSAAFGTGKITEFNLVANQRNMGWTTGIKIYIDNVLKRTIYDPGTIYVRNNEVYNNSPSPSPLSNATPQDLGTAAAGTSTSAARADHVHDMPTASDVSALPIAGGTMTGAIAMGGYKVTGLGTPSADGDAATKKYVDDEIAGIGTVFNIKGDVATVNDLPASGNAVGDVYYVQSVSAAFIWLETTAHPTGYWEEFGEPIDLSGYIEKPSSASANQILTFNGTAWVAASKPSYTASEVGLGNVDNTSDANKPVSTAQQAALDAKENKVTEVTVSTAGAVTQALDAGKVYHFTGALTALTITLNAAGSGVIPHYRFDFDAGSTAPTLTLPNTVTMPSGFSVTASHHYEVDILGTYGVGQEW